MFSAAVAAATIAATVASFAAAFDAVFGLPYLLTAEQPGTGVTASDSKQCFYIHINSCTCSWVCYGVLCMPLLDCAVTQWMFEPLIHASQVCVCVQQVQAVLQTRA